MQQIEFFSAEGALETEGVERHSGSDALEAILQRLKIAYDQSIIYAQELSQERVERKRAEAELHHRHEILKAQEESLEDVSTALKVLLQFREENKKELEEKVLANLKALILPCIDALKLTRLDRDQKVLIDLVETRLDHLVSPYMKKFAAENPELTPREIQVASFIKDGKTTKEIASLMHVSSRAIEFHRYNMRKKLGLAKSKTNLKTYLLSQA